MGTLSANALRGGGGSYLTFDMFKLKNKVYSKKADHVKETLRKHFESKITFSFHAGSFDSILLTSGYFNIPNTFRFFKKIDHKYINNLENNAFEEVLKS